MLVTDIYNMLFWRLLLSALAHIIVEKLGRHTAVSALPLEREERTRILVKPCLFVKLCL
jgi:hypothetical protein